MTIKTGIFFLLTFSCIITPFSGTIDHCCIRENLGQSGKKRTNLEQYTQKIMKILRTASLGSTFISSYKKRV